MEDWLKLSSLNLVGMMLRVGFIDVTNSLRLMGFERGLVRIVQGNYMQRKLLKDLIDDPLTELKNLKQDGTVKDYHENFESLLNRMELAFGIRSIRRIEGVQYGVLWFLGVSSTKNIFQNILERRYAISSLMDTAYR
ncbi:hypothetical protein Tco_1224232 [Tanacetum coccineum]